MDSMDLLADLRATYPIAEKLAIASSVPVRVSPAFLRLARLRLIPGASTGIEADLWMSDLVDARSSAGFSFRPEVRDLLRKHLTADPALLERIWPEIHIPQSHWLSPRMILEEELTWRLLRDSDDPWIGACWQQIWQDLHTDDNAEGIARWVIRAVPNLPTIALENEIAQRVRIAAHLLIGDASVLGDQPQRFIKTGEFNFAIKRLPKRSIYVGLHKHSVMVSVVQRIKNGHRIGLPATHPLWLQLENPEGTPLRVLTLARDDVEQIELDAQEIHLRLINGVTHRLIPENAMSGRTKRTIQHPRVQIEYDVEIGDAVRKKELPWVTGVMADLSGANAGGLPELADRTFSEVDAENFDAFMKDQTPRISFVIEDKLSGEGNIRIEATLESIDDFTPNGFIHRMNAENIDIILTEEVKGSDRRYVLDQENPESAAFGVSIATLDTLSIDFVASKIGEKAEDIDMQIVPNIKNKKEHTLKIIRKGPLAKLLNARSQLKENLSSKSPDGMSEIEAAVAEIDGRLSDQMNAILHHEDFQKLEGTWRGLHFLVNNTESSDRLKVKVLNVTKKEIYTQLGDSDQSGWDRTDLFKKIYEEEYGVPGGSPFGTIIGDYEFGPDERDLQILYGMSKIAAVSHAPFIASGSPALFGLESWSQINNPSDLRKKQATIEFKKWQSLRNQEDSRYLGLTAPRMLARTPYGSTTEPVDTFAFEEDTHGNEPRVYTWSSSAFAMGANVNRAFQETGWATQIRGLESGGIVDNLPTHVFPSDDGEINFQCPTEVLIPDRREKELADCGLMPLSYYKNTDYACFFGAQSLKNPAKYTDHDVTANETLSCRLPYIFAISRFAQYLKCMVRDKVGSFMEAKEMEHWLTNWLMQYVLKGGGDDALKGQKPLAEARIEITAKEGDPGSYKAELYLRPHFQLEGLTAPLRLNFEI